MHIHHLEAMIVPSVGAKSEEMGRGQCRDWPVHHCRRTSGLALHVGLHLELVLAAWPSAIGHQWQRTADCHGVGRT